MIQVSSSSCFFQNIIGPWHSARNLHELASFFCFFFNSYFFNFIPFNIYLFLKFHLHSLIEPKVTWNLYTRLSWLENKRRKNKKTGCLVGLTYCYRVHYPSHLFCGITWVNIIYRYLFILFFDFFLI